MDMYLLVFINEHVAAGIYYCPCSSLYVLLNMYLYVCIIELAVVIYY